ncbi:YcfA family protein (fragment) [Candidatus Promineifilum breve]|uniref:YcfA family protein n=1 Tax=Candidatus Promineifilum breve TaxID=1806508 RepID=A0A160T6M7_9CHLR
MPQLPILRSREVIDALRAAGFETVRQKGSHVRLRHPDGRVVTVPMHGSQDIGRGLLRKILRDADLTVEDLLSLLN